MAKITKAEVDFRVNLIGQKFGRLTVLEYSHTSKQRIHWLAQCECGKQTIVPTNHLRNGNTKSCGCLQRQWSIHGHIRGRKPSKTYTAWANMLDRCHNEKRKEYHRYGGRGIKVCARWYKFENFLADMGEVPAKLMLERINNDGDYEPANCKWATKKEQGRNTCQTKFYTYKGKQYMQDEMAKYFDLPTRTFVRWFKKGLSLDAINEKSIERLTWIPNA